MFARKVDSAPEMKLNAEILSRSPVLIWQTRVTEALDNFLVAVKEVRQALPPINIMISYVPGESRLDAAVALFAERLEQAGLAVTLSPLSDAATLVHQLENQTHAIVVCTPAYAARAEADPALRQVLETFGQTQKNALQPFLFEGDFGNTALKIVSSHYLIRSAQALLLEDPARALPTFCDVMLNLSGNQGLGLLPDILSLTETSHTELKKIYQTHYDHFERTERYAMIDYRLAITLDESLQTHPLREITTALPMLNDQPFEAAVETLLSSPAPIGLFLCPTKADTSLTSLALATTLRRSNQRVLTIECGEYPGRASANCVQLALQKAGLKGPHLALIREEPIIILFKGYENLGSYENLYVKNKLSTWKSVTLLVTCRSDFFKSRGYASCFLPEASDRKKREALIVYKLPSFASREAQHAAIAWQPHVVEDVLDVQQSSPKQHALRSELNLFLTQLHHYWQSAGYLPEHSPTIFISYAWEADKAALARQQGYLLNLCEDLRTLGFSPWLDIEKMSGDIDQQMTGNIAQSQRALIIGTDRYAERSRQETNVKKEFDAILQKAQTDETFQVFPLHFSGSIPFPETIMNHPHRRDFRNLEDRYVDCLLDPTTGLLSTLWLDTPTKQAHYQTAYAVFKEEFPLLIAKHLILNQGQEDLLSHDVEHRLEGYIQPYGLKEEGDPLEKRFDLNVRFNQMLSNQEIKTSVILARAGSGKSCFALSVLKALLSSWQVTTSSSRSLKHPTWLPLYIPLRDYIQAPDTCIESALRQQFHLDEAGIEALKHGHGHEQPLLFILDGYDELGHNVRPNLTQQLADWPRAKLLITSRSEHFPQSTPPSIILSLRSPTGGIVPNSVHVAFVSPFSPDEIQRYLAHYDQGKNQDSYQTLNALPGMMALLDNPFLLTIVLQSLPQLLKNREQEPDRAMTRYAIYQAFTETWFLQEIYGRDLSLEVCQQFSQILAVRFFQENTISVTLNRTEKPALSAFFNDEANQAAQDASPLRLSGGNYSFIHKSLYEFFLAQAILQNAGSEQALETRVANALMCLAVVRGQESKRIQQEPQALLFLQDVWIGNATDPLIERVKETFFAVVNASKGHPEHGSAAANAITILNWMGTLLTHQSWQDIQIPGANLAYAQLMDSDLTGANLESAQFFRAQLQNVNLARANLTDVDFAERAPIEIEGDQGCTAIAYHPIQPWIAVMDDMNLRQYDIERNAWLGEPLQGHRRYIQSIAYSSDGQFLASGSLDNMVRQWIAASGKPFGRVFKGHTDCVNSVAYSPDGRHLASGSSDKTIRQWVAAPGKWLGRVFTSVRVFKGHAGAVYSVIYSPDGLRLASGSNDKTIRLWNALSGELIVEPLTGHTAAVNSVAYSPDGLWLVSGSNDKTIRLWNALSGEPIGVALIGHTNQVNNVTFSPDGLRLVSGSDDNSIRQWNALTGETIGEALGGHTEAVKSVTYSPNSRWFASGGLDKKIRQWSVLSGATISVVMAGHTDWVNSVAYSLDGLRLASGSDDGTICQWNALSGELIGVVLVGHTGNVNSVAYSPDSRYLVSGGSDKTIRLWNALNGKPIGVPLVGHTNGVSSVTYSPDGKTLTSSSFDGTIRQWNALSGELIGEPLTGHTYCVQSVAYSPDGLSLVSGSYDKTIRLWNALSGEPIGVALIGHTDWVNNVTFSSDGLRLVSGSNDKTIRQWNALTGEPIGEPLVGHTRSVKSVTYSPDGLRLASGSADKTIRHWNALNGKLIGVALAGHTKVVNSVAYSPDGLRLVSGSDDHCICLWHIGIEGNFNLVWRTRSALNLLMTDGLRLSGVLGLRADQIALLAYAGCTETESVVPAVSSTAVISHNSSSFFNQNEHDGDKLAADEARAPSPPAGSN